MMGFKKGLSVSLAVILILLPAGQALAQGEETNAAIMQARADAQANTNATMWMGAGCLFGLLGWGAAYLITPNPPAISLLGKSPEYVAVYTDTYRETAKGIQTTKAAIGCVIGTLIQVVAIIIIVATEETYYYY